MQSGEPNLRGDDGNYWAGTGRARTGEGTAREQEAGKRTRELLEERATGRQGEEA
jgi:hypothetical protein